MSRIRVSKFGRNPVIDAAAAEDVWDGGAGHVPPTAARIHAIASTEVADDTGGTGAITVRVEGLDGNYDPQGETVTLNGTSSVNTVGSYIRIFRMTVLTAGSGGKNAGDITATAATDATVSAQITALFNQTLMAVFTVRAGYTGFLSSYYGSVAKAVATAAVDMTLLVKPDGEVWQTKHLLGLNSTGTSYLKHTFDDPLVLKAKTDIKLNASTSANNTDVSGGFDLVMEPGDLLQHHGMVA